MAQLGIVRCNTSQEVFDGTQAIQVVDYVAADQAHQKVAAFSSIQPIAHALAPMKIVC